jgi:hypothetical protein
MGTPADSQQVIFAEAQAYKNLEDLHSAPVAPEILLPLPSGIRRRRQKTVIRPTCPSGRMSPFKSLLHPCRTGFLKDQF